MKRVIALLLSTTSLLVSGGALAAPRSVTPARLHRGIAMSMGAPNKGQLQGGLLLKESDALRFLPNHHRRWGLPQLVHMIERSASHVRKRFAGSVLAVGDLSQNGGGDVSGHHSHESGRDADIGFFILNSAGKSYSASRLIPFDENGKGPEKLRFDVARNWTLVESWLKDPQARVSHIFVAAHLRDLLLAHAREKKVPVALRNRAALALMQPRGALPHDDHFHVRIACPKEQQSTCIEYAIRKPRVHKVVARRPAKKIERPIKKQAEKQAEKSPPKRTPSRPVIARARKRVGTTGKAPPTLVAVVPAPNDIDWE